MASSEKHIRMDNIKRAREVWRLKVEGKSIKDMANALSVTSETIEKILKYTVSAHYTELTQAPSYYDDKLLIDNKLLIERKKIEKAVVSIAQKKKILYIILEATAVIIFIFIMT